METFRKIFENNGTFVLSSSDEVDDVLMELSYIDGLGKNDYENNTSSGKNGTEYAVYSDTKKGQAAIKKVLKKLKIKSK